MDVRTFKEYYKQNIKTLRRKIENNSRHMSLSLE